MKAFAIALALLAAPALAQDLPPLQLGVFGQVVNDCRPGFTCRATRFKSSGTAASQAAFWSNVTGANYVLWNGVLPGTTGWGIWTNSSNGQMNFQIGATTVLTTTVTAVTSNADFSAGGVFKTGNGSAAAPAYSFTTDLTAGMYRLSGGELGFSVAGTRQLYIATNGAVALNLGQVVGPNSSFGLDIASKSQLYGGAGFIGINSSGATYMDSTDNSGTPGDSVTNKNSGRNAFATGDDTITVTNSLVTATTKVFAQLNESDSAGAGWISDCVPTAGSFTCTCIGSPSTNVTFSWFIMN